MDSLFLKLLNMSITAGWLVLAVILIRQLIKKAPKWISCALWALVAIRLVCPFTIESVLSLIPSAEPVPQEILISEEPHIETGVPVIDEPVNERLAETSVPEPVESVNPMQVTFAVLSYIWVAGVVMMAAYAVFSYYRIKKKVEASIEDSKQVRLCDNITSPFILGVLFPTVYLPSDIEDPDREFVLAHEKAHIKRKDHIWKPLGFALLSVYWFNPLMWLGYILLCRDIEAACDEKVIEEKGEWAKKPYSEALVNCSVERKKITACPLAFGETDVKGRIKKVLDYKKPAFWIIVAAIVAVAVTAVCFLTNPIIQEKEKVVKEMTVTDSGSFGEVKQMDVMKSEEGDRTVLGIEIEWKNTNNDNLIVTGDFRIYKERDGAWNKLELKTDAGQSALLYGIKDGKTKQMSYNISDYYDISIMGKYRFETDFYYQCDNCCTTTAWMEFDVTANPIEIPEYTAKPEASKAPEEEKKDEKNLRITYAGSLTHPKIVSKGELEENEGKISYTTSWNIKNVNGVISYDYFTVSKMNENGVFQPLSEIKGSSFTKAEYRMDKSRGVTVYPVEFNISDHYDISGEGKYHVEVPYKVMSRSGETKEYNLIIEFKKDKTVRPDCDSVKNPGMATKAFDPRLDSEDTSVLLLQTESYQHPDLGWIQIEISGKTIKTVTPYKETKEIMKTNGRILAIYFCDLTGDGFSEVCIETNYNTGAEYGNSHGVCAYDCLTDTVYEFENRWAFDFRLFMRKGKLYVQRGISKNGDAERVIAEEGLLCIYGDKLGITNRTSDEWKDTGLPTQNAKVLFDEKLKVTLDDSLNGLVMNLQIHECFVGIVYHVNEDNYTMIYSEEKKTFEGSGYDGSVTGLYTADLNRDGYDEYFMTKKDRSTGRTYITMFDYVSGNSYSLKDDEYNYSICCDGGKICYTKSPVSEPEKMETVVVTEKFA